MAEHVIPYTGASIDEAIGKALVAVTYSSSYTLSSDEKKIARENINAADVSDFSAVSATVSSLVSTASTLGSGLSALESTVSNLQVSNAQKVDFIDSQSLTDTQKATARENINAAATDGYYENLGAGTAEQLVSSIYEEDNTPYNFRTSGGSIDIGDRETDKLVGGTVAWNQLASLNPSDWNMRRMSMSVNDRQIVFTPTVSTSSLKRANILGLVPGHKYLSMFSQIASGTTRFVSFGIYTNADSNSYTSRKYTQRSENDELYVDIWNVTANDSMYSFAFSTAATTEDHITLKNVTLFDLTQMFGSTIADYIYGLETNHAGDGVAWFRKLFPKDYYAYNSGGLMSVQTSAHNMTGFNQWDEQWELGTINITTGANVTGTANIRSKNYIPIVPNTDYYMKKPAYKGTFWIIWYDSGKNRIIHDSIGSSLEGAIKTTPENARYVRFYIGTEYGTTYNHDICINLHWDGERDGEYEPYELHSYPLDSSLTLRGILNLDSDNKLYYDGDTYESDGTVTRKYGIVNLGTLDWLSSGSAGQFVYEDASFDGANDAYGTHMLCSSILMGGNAYSGAEDNVICAQVGTYKRLWAKCSAYQTADAFKTAMSGVYLVYELATPTTESAEPYTNPQIVNDWGTEEYVDYPSTLSTPTRDVAIPVGHETRYQANLKAKLEMAPDSPSDNGDYLMRHANGQNSYVQYTDGGRITTLEGKIPTAPTTDGVYKLTCTVTDGTAVYSWVAEE